MKNISVFIDGTWSEPDDRTNVYRLSQLAKGEVIYLGGPGNQDDYGLLGQLFGGAFGLGSERIVQRAIEQLINAYEPGDRVYVFGFSRGAALARILCSRLLSKVTIEFLGCWDTVAAFGIPVDIGPFKFQKANLFKGKDLTISANIKKALHLVAFHETRHAFEPTLMNYRPGIVDEIWFAGSHEDLGGSDATLAYMAQEACKSRFELSSMPESAPIEINRPTGIVSAYKRRPREPRVLRNGIPAYSLNPRLHSSVLDGFEIVRECR